MNNSTATPGSAQVRPASAAAQWYGLALLTLVYTINQIDRSSMIVVLEPIKREFALSDGQLGFLTGLAFAMVYAVFAIPVGMLADRVNRRNLLACLLAVWSTMTIACGLARNFALLLAARMCVGAAEAGASPVSSSIISDLFPPQRRATAVAIYFIGTPLASIISFLFGSAIAAEFGWRATFFLAGSLGLVLTPLLFLIMREPQRGAADQHGQAEAHAPGAARAGLRELVASPVLLCVFAGMTLATLVSTAFQAWALSLLIREHGMDLKAAGAAIAVCFGVCGAVGAATTGSLADAYAKGDSRRLLLFTACVMLAVMACEFLAAGATTRTLAIAGLVGFGLFNLGGLGPGFSVVLNTTSPAHRGMMIAAQQVLVTLFGAGIGPWAAGMLSDNYGGARSISNALTTMAPIMVIASGFNVAAWLHLGRAPKQP